MQESTKQIVIAVAASAAAAATAAIVTHWLTKESTTKDIASGKTPLPAGSTPTMKCPEGTYAKDGGCVQSPLIEGQPPTPPDATPKSGATQADLLNKAVSIAPPQKKMNQFQ